jgi:hypothetical protein
MRRGARVSRDQGPPLRPQTPVRTPPRRTPWVTIAGLVLLGTLGIVLLALIFGDGDDGDLIASPSPTAAPANGSFQPSAPASAADQPSQTPTGELPGVPDGLVPPGIVAEVLVDALNLRAGPPGDPRHEEIVTVLAAGTGVYVAAQPFAVDAAAAPNGQRWYQVFVLPQGGGPLPAATSEGGWIAAGTPDEPYLRAGGFGCEPPVDDQAVVDAGELALSPAFIRLACLSGAPIRVAGTLLSCQQSDPAPALEPAWLVNSSRCLVLVSATWDPETQQEAVPGIDVVVNPETGLTLPASGTVLEMTGHFNDPTAESCARTGPEDPPVDPDFLILSCREQFVIDSITAAVP